MRINVIESCALACINYGLERAERAAEHISSSAESRADIVAALALGFAVRNANTLAPQYGAKASDVARAIHRLAAPPAKPTPLRIRDFSEHQSITDEQAAQIFPPEVLQQGGGWGSIEGVKVYGHTGSHRDGTNGWKIHSFGGLR